MSTTTVLGTVSQFMKEFQRCCREYTSLDIAVAWCGNPKTTLPHQLLDSFVGPNVKALVGVSFHHTHPDAIQWLMDIGADLRIVRDSDRVFHPKIYLFRKGRAYALFVGSSNFTYSGFSQNHETNCLVEGRLSNTTSSPIAAVETMVESWRYDKFSFQPTRRWLAGYRRRHARALEKQRQQNLPTPPITDDDIPATSWIQVADWSVYYNNVATKLEQHGDREGRHNVLNLAVQNVPVPWTRQYFADIENRRIIGGYPPYGWFGHAGAAGSLRHILGSGTAREQNTVVQVINTSSQFPSPLPYDALARQLTRLTRLGLTMRAWSRLLCIVRPDLYCTIASPSVRKGLSKACGISQNRLSQVDGYIELLTIIHNSPWYNSTIPRDRAEAAIWQRRVAFLDAIYYEEK